MNICSIVSRQIVTVFLNDTKHVLDITRIFSSFESVEPRKQSSGRTTIQIIYMIFVTGTVPAAGIIPTVGKITTIRYNVGALLR